MSRRANSIMESRTNQNTTRWLIAAVLVWGSVLAWGGYRAFASRGGLWHGTIILACVLGFVTFWLIFLVSRRSATLATSDAPARIALDDLPAKNAPQRRSWSRAGWASWTLAVVASLCVGIVRWALIAPGNAWQGGATALAWLTVALTGVSLIVSLVALSDPRPRRGRWLGLVAIPWALANPVWLLLTWAATR